MTRQPTFDRQRAYYTHDRIREIVDHASRVLRKFPFETVPEDLKWIARNHHSEIFHRIGERGIRLVIIPMFGESVRRSLPLDLLDAPEKDIHKWARKSYWEGVNHLRQKRHEQSMKNLREAKRKLAEAQGELDSAREAFYTSMDSRIQR